MLSYSPRAYAKCSVVGDYDNVVIYLKPLTRTKDKTVISAWVLLSYCKICNCSNKHTELLTR